METVLMAERRSIGPMALLLTFSGLALVAITGCDRNSEGTRAADARALRLVTTTSTRDSGLLDVLLPEFESQFDCRVDVVAVGTGAALKCGEQGDADIIVVHAREAEEAFLKAGHGTRHEEFMVNEFTILGPADDPAQIRDREPVRAFRQIADRRCRFVSRGDDSGTHKREISLWEAAGGRPDWKDYLESGQGMGPTLVIADEKQGYVLADMGTFLRFREKIELIPLAAAAESLRNPYAAIVVNPDIHPSIDAPLANALVDFFISPEVQQLIGGFRVAGQPLFQPTRLKDYN